MACTVSAGGVGATNHAGSNQSDWSLGSRSLGPPLWVGAVDLKRSRHQRSGPSVIAISYDDYQLQPPKNDSAIQR